jgi:hypothetical protein
MQKPRRPDKTLEILVDRSILHRHRIFGARSGAVVSASPWVKVKP